MALSGSLTWVLESGRSQGRVPFRRSSAILALSLWARTIVRGIHSSVSSVAYPNIRPCQRSSHISQREHEAANSTTNSHHHQISGSCYPAVAPNTNRNARTLRPGRRLPRPPLYGPGERPERCQGTAAPEPPARCRS